jgi:membrane protease YdiL (CAAX protease family)
MAPLITGRQLLAALGVWLLASSVAAGATVLALRSLVPNSASNPNILSPIIVAEVYALLIAALAVVLRPRFRELVALRRPAARDVALAAAACAAAYPVTGLIQALIAPQSWTAALAILPAMFSDDGRLASAGPTMTAVILIRACGLAAIGEELLFRGTLYAWLRRRLSATTTIVITAAAFAAIHGFPPILPLAFAIGIGFGWIRERSGSTVPAIIVHALNNALMIALSYSLTGWTARLPPW